jgi:SAM-dependent methyltransferase
MTNAEYINRTTEVESKIPKGPPQSREYAKKTARFFTRMSAQILGRRLNQGASVLDFGCGIGYLVDALVGTGMDAAGVDILEYWGKDSHLIGEEVWAPSGELRSRLHLVSAQDNILPFADSSFDLVVSDQVLEHVFDLRPAFAEQARVLKPGGIAIHRMPKSYNLMEPHTKLPLTVLNRSRAYLTLCALLGARNARQQAMSWRETVESNVAIFATTHYLSKRAILEAAASLPAKAYFADHLAISESRVGILYQRFSQFGLGELVKPLLSAVCMNWLLVLEKRA